MATDTKPPKTTPTEAATAETEDDFTSVEERVFIHNLAAMSSLLSIECVSVATNALAAGLIEVALANRVINSEPLTPQKRAFSLLLAISEKFDLKKPEEAPDTMDKFVGILKQNVSMHGIADSLGKPNNK